MLGQMIDPAAARLFIFSREPTQRRDEAEELSAVSLEVFLDLHLPGFLLLATATRGATLVGQHRLGSVPSVCASCAHDGL